MANVLLIAPTGSEDGGIEAYAAPHHGLHRIAGWLRYHGHRCRVWDQWYDDCSLEEILQQKPAWDLIGFSTISHTLAWDIEAMREAHRLCPEAILVAGGMESAMNFQEIFDHTDVHGIILAEGEEPMLHLCQCIDGKILGGIKQENNSLIYYSIPGMIWRHRAKQIDALTLWKYYEHMNFSSMGYERYWERIRQLTGNRDYEPDIRLVTETHCNRNCIFCTQTNFHRRAIGHSVPPAILSAEQIFKIICRAKRELPDLKKVYFDGDDFFIDRERAFSFFSRYAQRESLAGFKYLVEASLTSIDEELIRVGAKNGLVLLNMGLENCSERVLRSLGKPQKVQKCFDVIYWCRCHNVEPYILILLFPPESTIEDLKLNLSILTQFMESGATLSIIPNLRPYRGTRLYEMDYDFHWETISLDLPGLLDRQTGQKGKRGALKQATIAWCRDPEARSVQQAFWREWPKQLDRIKRERGYAFRRQTAPEMLHLLKEILDKRI